MHRLERVGQEEVGWVTCWVTCTWWLLGLAVKESWFGPMGHLSPWLHGQASLQNTTIRVDFCQGRLLGLWAGVWQPRELTIACSWLRSWVYLLMLEVDLGSGLETEMVIWCIKGMCMLKVVWSEKNFGYVAVPGRIKHYFVAYFTHIAVLEALLHGTAIKGRAHTCWVKSSILATFTQRVWPPPLTEVLHYSASNLAMRAKYTE